MYERSQAKRAMRSRASFIDVIGAREKLVAKGAEATAVRQERRVVSLWPR